MPLPICCNMRTGTLVIGTLHLLVSIWGVVISAWCVSDPTFVDDIVGKGLVNFLSHKGFSSTNIFAQSMGRECRSVQECVAPWTWRSSLPSSSAQCLLSASSLGQGRSVSLSHFQTLVTNVKRFLTTLKSFVLEEWTAPAVVDSLGWNPPFLQHLQCSL